MLNNPINASDPTGHQCYGEPDECLEDDGTTGPGFPGTGGGGGSGGGAGGGTNDDDNDDDDNPWHPEITVPDNVPCGGLLICPLSNPLPVSLRDACLATMSTGMQTICDAKAWGLFFDPSNPYSFNGAIPGIEWYSGRVPWLTVYVDAIGIAGDLFPPFQPGAEGIEVLTLPRYIGKVHQSLGLAFDEADLYSTYVTKHQQSYDFVNAGLDIGSLIPKVGMPFSVSGLLYNLGKGINFYNRVDAFYGLPNR